MLANLFTFLRGAFGVKARLIVEYVLIALLMALLGFTLSLYISKLKQDVEVSNLKGELQLLNGEVAGLKVVNELHKEDIITLKELRYVDGELLGKLANQMKQLAKADTEFKLSLMKLEAEDATVRAFLNNSVPPQLRCVLEQTCQQPVDVPRAGP